MKYGRSVLALASFVMSPLALADQSVQQIGLSAASLITNVNSNTSIDTTLPVAYGKFNPALGTLTGVKFDYHYDFNLHFVTGGAGGSSSGSAGGPISINGVPGVTGGGNGTGGGGGPNSVLDFPFTVAGSFSPTGDLSGFIASSPGENGGFDFSPTVNAGPDSGATASVGLLGTSSVSVTYTYTPVPEPMGLGLIVTGGLILRRRARRATR